MRLIHIVQSSQCQKMNHIGQRAKIALVQLFLLGCLGLSGCTGFVAIDDKFSKGKPSSAIHIVQKSETLFSLAWRYGWDYKALASANNIKPPYIIHPGQKVHIAHSIPKHLRGNKNTSKKLTNVQKAQYASAPSAYKKPKKVSKQAMPSGGPAWKWPAKGSVIAKFSAKAPVNKGIDIKGRLGEPVMAAAAGSVVYAGSGLLGYGNLVILKHNDDYLSAYAHNKRLLVKEGQLIKVGQAIAEIGSSGTDNVKLHFEIRRRGKPVDPMIYLPKAK